jgi:hypothetical protein
LRRHLPLLRLLLLTLLTGAVAIIAGTGAEAIPAHPSAKLPPPLLSSKLGVAEKRKLHPALKEDDIGRNEQLLTNQILSFLPSFCADALSTFVVRYEPDAHRGLGGGNTIIVKGLQSPTFPAGISMEEYVSIIAHECAHLFVSANRGTAASLPSPFNDGTLPIYSDSPLLQYFTISWDGTDDRRPADVKGNHCSGYGYETDAHEDLAECFVLAALHSRTFKERATENRVMAAKLRWLQTFMLSDFTPLRGEEWNGNVPWDATKLPHTFFSGAF